LLVLPGAWAGPARRLPRAVESRAAERRGVGAVLAAAATDAGADAARVGAILPVDRATLLPGAAPAPQRAAGASGRVRLRIGIVAQVRRQPALHLLQRHLLARRIIAHLVDVALAAGEVARAGMREIPAAHRSRRIHRERLGDLDARIRFRIE